jgi:hypothetical protein
MSERSGASESGEQRNHFYLIQLKILNVYDEDLDGHAVSALGARSRKLSNVRKGRSSDGRPIFCTDPN